MDAHRRRAGGTTRRAFIGSLSTLPLAANSQKGQVYPADWRKYLDPATEFEILRLTDPSYTSLLPAFYDRAIARRGNFLIYTSDRSGSKQAFRLDLKSGIARQLTEASDIDSASVTLVADERTFCYVDGRRVVQSSLSGLREREVYAVPEDWTRGAGFSVSEDGLYCFLVERQEKLHRLRMIPMARGAATTVVQAETPISDPMPRPKRAGLLYRRSEPQGPSSVWLVNYDGQQDRRLRIGGGAGPAQWSPDGRTVVYIGLPDENQKLSTIRECTPDANTDQVVSTTSQFVHFGRNSDASVFVGASGSKAAPYLLLLLRVARRELTLCEHRSSDPMLVAPVFSPSSQRVFFQSDRHGKPAIYTMAVERFVEETSTE